MERQIEAALMSIFDAIEYCDPEDLRETEAGLADALGAIQSAETYEEAGVLTRDQGIRIRRQDGRDVYLTIKLQ